MVMEIEELRKYKDDLWELETRLNSRRKVETVLKLYSVLGALISIFALAYFLLSTLDIQLSLMQQMTLMIAGVGIALSMTSWAMLLFRRQRELEEVKRIKAYQGVSQIIFLWAEFEEAGKSKLDDLDISYSKHSIRQVINLLEEKNVINPKDRILVDEAMQIRNAAAHGRAEFSQELVKQTAEAISRIIDKVRGANE